VRVCERSTVACCAAGMRAIHVLRLFRVVRFQMLRFAKSLARVATPAARTVVSGNVVTARTATSMSVRDALGLAMKEEMERDDKVVLIGEEVGQFHGAYKVGVVDCDTIVVAVMCPTLDVLLTSRQQTVVHPSKEWTCDLACL
jgi:hypothetical protein